MSKCAHCGARKGKRACPALCGVICTPCCGRHRERDIACPTDCRYATGAAIAPRSSEPNAFVRLRARLTDFARHQRDIVGEARALFADRHEKVEDWEASNLEAFVLHGHAGPDGARVVDRFAQEHARRLPADERQALEAQLQSWFSLFEVQEVRREEGLILSDLLANDAPIVVRERALTRQAVRYDVLATWVGPVGGDYVLPGGVAVVPPAHIALVVQATRTAAADLQARYPGADRKVLGRGLCAVAHRTLRKAIASWRPPSLQTAEGDDVAFCEAVFDVIDEEAVRERLAARADMEVTPRGFQWLDRPGSGLAGGRRHLGTVENAAQRLVLRTQSQARLERGKDLLRETLGAAVVHRLDGIQDVESARRKHKRRPQAGEPDAIPPEVRAAVIQQFFERHMQEWIDSPLPVLGGKTPREAVQRPDGRVQVRELIKSQENSARHMAGGEGVDLSWVFTELGL
jgi:hypothetical protein